MGRAGKVAWPTVGPTWGEATMSRKGLRSTLKLFLAGTLTLTVAARALGQTSSSPSFIAQQNAGDAQPTPPAPVPSQPPSVSPTPAPIVNAPEQANSAPQSNPPLESGSLLAYSLASVPDMIGDTLPPGRFNVTLLGTLVSHGASIPIAAGNAYSKIADDTSPLPTDRVFFDYDYFNHAVQTANGQAIGLNSYTFGLEKTFFDGWCSVEVTAPIESGLASNQSLVGTTADNQGTCYGDMTVTFKCLVYRSCSFAVCAGMMVDLPTAPNGSFNAYGTSLTLDNNSVHVAPFMGFAYAPCCSNFFALGFVQADVDCNGDPLYSNAYIGTDPQIGRFRDPSLLYVDLSTGYWLFREDQECCGRYLTGIAPTVELHYTTNLQGNHGYTDGLFDTITPVYGGIDCLNLTGGVHFQLGPCSMLTVAAAVPLRDSQRDREFDSELTAQFDRRF